MPPHGIARCSKSTHTRSSPGPSNQHTLDHARISESLGLSERTRSLPLYVKWINDMPPSESGALGRLSRLRRDNSDKNGSTASLGASSDGDGDAPEFGVGLKANVDSAMERLRSKTRRTSVDERRGSGDSTKRLSKLMPGRRRGSKKNTESVQSTSRDDLASRDTLERSPSGGIDNTLLGNQSDSSVDLQGSGRSSLLTDDASEQDG